MKVNVGKFVRAETDNYFTHDADFGREIDIADGWTSR
jgi:hypothetical protein